MRKPINNNITLHDSQIEVCRFLSVTVDRTRRSALNTEYNFIKMCDLYLKKKIQFEQPNRMNSNSVCATLSAMASQRCVSFASEINEHPGQRVARSLKDHISAVFCYSI